MGGTELAGISSAPATVATRRVVAISTNAGRSAWGRLPILSLVAVVGLFGVAAANVGAQAGAWWANATFYVGLLVLIVPIGLRLVGTAAAREERIGLVVLLGLALFVCKVLRDPLRVGAYDEFLHLRTAEDIVLTGTVFSPNTLLGVSPYYPGLELATTALSESAGIPIFEASVLALALARLAFVLALYLFFEMASGSSRIAGIAALIYMLNPKFLYFNAQFSYETLALPLAAIVLYLLVRRGHSDRSYWFGLTVIALVTAAAVVTTHHVTSVMLAIFLAVWGVVAVIVGRRDAARSHPGRMALAMIVMIAGWTLLVANATVGYLGPAVASTVTEMLRLISGELDPRALFVSRAGDVSPVWERVTGSLSAAIILVLLPFGLLVVWRNYRAVSVVAALALVAALYPVTLVARLTRVGAEVATRTPEFLFLGIGLVIAFGFVRFSYGGRFAIARWGVVGALVGALAVGGVIVGVAPWARLPGPYLVSADARSIEAEGISAATWAREVLGPGNGMVADRVNRILMAAYGQQTMITTYETRVPVRRLYLSPDVGPIHRELVRQGGIRYLVADRRLTTGLPVVGHYFDRGEEAVVGRRQTPLDPALLSKFDTLPEVSRIFDSGSIQVYDIAGLAAQN